MKELSESGLQGIGRKIGDYGRLSQELSIGELTLRDMVKELEKPARDPRDEMPKPILRTDVMDIKDLKPGMILKGTVRNVIDFGVFVDIGVHQDGLVHISQMTDRYIKHPLEVVSFFPMASQYKESPFIHLINHRYQSSFNSGAPKPDRKAVPSP